MVEGIKDVSKLEDPVNKTLWGIELDKGLELYRVSCPIGLIGVIFESRPDVVPQIASLAIKSSNSVILKGGTEADNSNQIIVDKKYNIEVSNYTWSLCMFTFLCILLFYIIILILYYLQVHSFVMQYSHLSFT